MGGGARTSEEGTGGKRRRKRCQARGWEGWQARGEGEDRTSSTPPSVSTAASTSPLELFSAPRAAPSVPDRSASELWARAIRPRRAHAEKRKKETAARACGSVARCRIRDTTRSCRGSVDSGPLRDGRLPDKPASGLSSGSDGWKGAPRVLLLGFVFMGWDLRCTV